jgi:hypothetical protein
MGHIYEVLDALPQDSSWCVQCEKVFSGGAIRYERGYLPYSWVKKIEPLPKEDEVLDTSKIPVSN